jgi:ABC-2 type transport system permease protein
MSAVYALWKREIVRFVRQRSRLTGAIMQPLFFWLLFGVAFGATFRTRGADGVSDANYMQYYFPGTIALIVLFSSIYSTISIIEDRNVGFLQSVLVAPVSRASIVAGKVLGGATMAFGQAFVFLMLAPLAGVTWNLTAFVATLGVLALMSITLTALGFCIAWRMESTSGFHAIMSAVLLPMWLLSGAFFPADGLPWWLATIIAINPLSYGVAALRRSLYLGAGSFDGTALPSMTLSLGVTVAFLAVTFILALRLAATRVQGDFR